MDFLWTFTPEEVECGTLQNGFASMGCVTGDPHPCYWKEERRQREQSQGSLQKAWMHGAKSVSSIVKWASGPSLQTVGSRMLG